MCPISCWAISGKARNKAMHCVNGNISEHESAFEHMGGGPISPLAPFELRFSNITSLVGKSGVALDAAVGGVHLIAETKATKSHQAMLRSLASTREEGESRCELGPLDLTGERPKAGIGAVSGRRCLGQYRELGMPPNLQDWYNLGRIAGNALHSAEQDSDGQSREFAAYLFVFYGYSRAEIDRTDQILVALEEFMSSLGQCPVFLFGDFNLQPEGSAVLSWWAAGRHGTFMHDVFQDFARAEGVEAENTTQASRIGQLWVNSCAWPMIRIAQLEKERFRTQRTLVVQVSFKPLVSKGWARVKPKPLLLECVRELSDAEIQGILGYRSEEWNSAQARFQNEGLGIRERRNGVDRMFEIWAHRAEYFLYSSAGMKWYKRLQQRGGVMPVVETFMAEDRDKRSRDLDDAGGRALVSRQLAGVARKLCAVIRMQPTPKRVATWRNLVRYMHNALQGLLCNGSITSRIPFRPNHFLRCLVGKWTVTSVIEQVR